MRHLFLHRNFGRRLVACGHSAGAHLVSTLVATDWQASTAACRSISFRDGIGISGVFDLAPLIETEMNEQLRLDESESSRCQLRLLAAPRGARFEAWVGGDESSEFLRQSRLVAELWKRRVQTRAIMRSWAPTISRPRAASPTRKARSSRHWSPSPPAADPRGLSA